MFYVIPSILIESSLGLGSWVVKKVHMVYIVEYTILYMVKKKQLKKN